MSHFLLLVCSTLTAALKNDPVYASTHRNDMKRYLRFLGNVAHPEWITYSERFLLPPVDGNPNYFFIRKLDIRAEPAMVKWIKTNYLDPPRDLPCETFHMFERPKCLQQVVEKMDIAHGSRKSLVIILINRAFYDIAMNAYCSMKKQNIHNIFFWSLDLGTHEKLLSLGYHSFINKKNFLYEGSMKWRDLNMMGIMRQKPNFLHHFIKEGYDVWLMDADIVALKDFRKLAADENVDIYLAIDQMDIIPEEEFSKAKIQPVKIH